MILLYIELEYNIKIVCLIDELAIIYNKQSIIKFKGLGFHSKINVSRILNRSFFVMYIYI